MIKAWLCSFWLTLGVNSYETYKNSNVQLKKYLSTTRSPRTLQIKVGPMEQIPSVVRPKTASEFDMASLLRNNPELLEKYKEFLTGEFSIENISFWEDYERIKQAPIDTEDTSREYKRIYNLYFRADSTLELNISSQIVNKIHLIFKGYPPLIRRQLRFF